MKLQVVNDDYQSFRTLSCGFTATGAESKRILSIKLHKKKCEVCSKINVNATEMARIEHDDIPIKKQNYLSYVKGEYNRPVSFTVTVIEKNT
jgi:hypothetical protein